eukprot:TRINITY_DN869_c0_g1_i3.p2 TRINITY_DN869_c0_g1~~TRINITY_DN869_c0_g1_i3.p2  ORF type:complete len:199 (+),score=52.10 TRINITY_DN869_c0_g1_i3:174-770(+)
MMHKWKMSDIEEEEVMWIVVRDVLFLISTPRSLFGSLLLLFDFDPSFISFFKRKLEQWGNFVEFDEPSNVWEVGEKRRCRQEVGEILPVVVESCKGMVVVGISPEEVGSGNNMEEEEISQEEEVNGSSMVVVGISPEEVVNGSNMVVVGISPEEVVNGSNMEEEETSPEEEVNGSSMVVVGTSPEEVGSGSSMEEEET